MKNLAQAEEKHHPLHCPHLATSHFSAEPCQVGSVGFLIHKSTLTLPSRFLACHMLGSGFPHLLTIQGEADQAGAPPGPPFWMQE